MDIRRLGKGLMSVTRWIELANCLVRSAQPITDMTGYLRLRRLDYPYHFSTRAGDRLVLTSWEDLTTAWVVFYGREYRIPPHARLVLDLGANIGAFVLLAARHAPAASIWAVEPSPSTRIRLQETLQTNRLTQRVNVLPYAVSGRMGEVWFAESEDIPTHSRALVDESDHVSKVKVQSVTLAHLLKSLGTAHVDLLKIDIEGSEYELIEEAPSEALRCCHRIVIEYHGNGDTAALIEKIRTAGFRMARHIPNGRAGIVEFHLNAARA